MEVIGVMAGVVVGGLGIALLIMISTGHGNTIASASVNLAIRVAFGVIFVVFTTLSREWVWLVGGIPLAALPIALGVMHLRRVRERRECTT